MEECKNHSGLKKGIENLEKSDAKQWTQIEDLWKALTKLVPAWATLVLMAMSALTGSALTFAGMIIRFAGQK